MNLTSSAIVDQFTMGVVTKRPERTTGCVRIAFALWHQRAEATLGRTTNAGTEHVLAGVRSKEILVMGQLDDRGNRPISM